MSAGFDLDSLEAKIESVGKFSFNLSSDDSRESSRETVESEHGREIMAPSQSMSSDRICGVLETESSPVSHKTPTAPSSAKSFSRLIGGRGRKQSMLGKTSKSPGMNSSMASSRYIESSDEESEDALNESQLILNGGRDDAFNGGSTGFEELASFSEEAKYILQENLGVWKANYKMMGYISKPMRNFCADFHVSHAFAKMLLRVDNIEDQIAPYLASPVKDRVDVDGRTKFDEMGSSLLKQVDFMIDEEESSLKTTENRAIADRKAGAMKNETAPSTFTVQKSAPPRAEAIKQVGIMKKKSAPSSFAIQKSAPPRAPAVKQRRKPPVPSSIVPKVKKNRVVRNSPSVGLKREKCTSLENSKEFSELPRNDVADELNVLASSALRGIGKKKKSTMPKKKVSVKVISSKKRLVKGARVGGLVTSIGSKTKTGHATAEIKCPKKKVAQSKTGIYDRTVAWQEKQFAKREESAALQKRKEREEIEATQKLHAVKRVNGFEGHKFFERNKIWTNRVEQRIQKLQEDKEAEEDKLCDFNRFHKTALTAKVTTPSDAVNTANKQEISLDDPSNRTALAVDVKVHNLALYERRKRWQEEKHKKIKEKLELKEKEEMSECTHTPILPGDKTRREALAAASLKRRGEVDIEKFIQMKNDTKKQAKKAPPPYKLKENWRPSHTAKPRSAHINARTRRKKIPPSKKKVALSRTLAATPWTKTPKRSVRSPGVDLFLDMAEELLESSEVWVKRCKRDRMELDRAISSAHQKLSVPKTAWRHLNSPKVEMVDDDWVDEADIPRKQSLLELKKRLLPVA
jgi:hypothetical protein